MISVRRATEDDVKLLFDWRNDKEVRQYAFDGQELKWDDHCQWFQAKRNDPSCFIFIVMAGNVPIGQVRFENESRSGEKVASAHINICESYRNKGYGTQGLKIAMADFIQEENPDKVMAYIKENNISSLRSFEKAGFKQLGLSKIKSSNCYVMEFKRMGPA